MSDPLNGVNMDHYEMPYDAPPDTPAGAEDLERLVDHLMAACVSAGGCTKQNCELHPAAAKDARQDLLAAIRAQRDRADTLQLENHALRNEAGWAVGAVTDSSAESGTLVYCPRCSQTHGEKAECDTLSTWVTLGVGNPGLRDDIIAGIRALRNGLTVLQDRLYLAEKWPEVMTDAIKTLRAQLATQSAAHAAQMGAMREAACGTVCGYCRNGIPVVEGTPFETGHRWWHHPAPDVQHIRNCGANGIRSLPLPDAEAALAPVREEAVRDAVERMSDEAIAKLVKGPDLTDAEYSAWRESGWSGKLIERMMADKRRAALLNALAGKEGK